MCEKNHADLKQQLDDLNRKISIGKKQLQLLREQKKNTAIELRKAEEVKNKANKEFRLYDIRYKNYKNDRHEAIQEMKKIEKALSAGVGKGDVE